MRRRRTSKRQRVQCLLAWSEELEQSLMRLQAELETLGYRRVNRYQAIRKASAKSDNRTTTPEWVEIPLPPCSP